MWDFLSNVLDLFLLSSLDAERKGRVSGWRQVAAFVLLGALAAAIVVLIWTAVR